MGAKNKIGPIVTGQDFVGRVNEIENTWDERLSYYPDDESCTRLLLNELSKSKVGISKNGLQLLITNQVKDEENAAVILTQLLVRLKNDGYIMINDKQKYVFRSPVLRDFWFNRFIK